MTVTAPLRMSWEEASGLQIKDPVSAGAREGGRRLMERPELKGRLDLWAKAAAREDPQVSSISLGLVSGVERREGGKVLSRGELISEAPSENMRVCAGAAGDQDRSTAELLFH